MMKLTPYKRRAFIFLIKQKCSYKEIGEYFKISSAEVSKIWKQLKAQLEQEGKWHG